MSDLPSINKRIDGAYDKIDKVDDKVVQFQIAQVAINEQFILCQKQKNDKKNNLTYPVIVGLIVSIPEFIILIIQIFHH